MRDTELYFIDNGVLFVEFICHYIQNWLRDIKNSISERNKMSILDTGAF